ncbi:nucleotidyltransferase [Candidatus Igneacidithiobacillus taiwanensis]|uniref:nucleotidyltransferase n=1 Tax=Candidatus Igneacidithiobacillus taiwanensis TaxID=1945924 RepID=UPI00289F0022|nr:nucleotidyltransferase [Candidatus Igneacidithiobacillus taiwanensis]
MAKSPQRVRRLLAVEAARIMVEEAVGDFRSAKEKAARRLGVDAQQHWPSNTEIHSELQARLQLFHADTQPLALRHLREISLQAMEWLQAFQPRLVGSVLEGDATEHSKITLHLFADAPESVMFFLLDAQQEYEEGWQRLHFGDGPMRDYPLFTLDYQGVPLRLVVFSLDEDRRSPASARDGKPLRRAGVGQLRRLLAEATPAPETASSHPWDEDVANSPGSMPR